MNRPSEILIEASDISIRLQGRQVLSGVNLQVRRREILTLIGPNGAGKTTLVRILLGLLTAETGRIQRAPGVRIGYMPQRLALSENLPLTVRRFLNLGCNSCDSDVMKSADELGIRHLLESPMQRLSGGENQRVLLARALLRRPDLLVLDEPVQGVDVTGQSALYSLISHIRDRLGCGVLMISHDLHLVMATTDHVLCLHHHVCCSGHPENVSRDPAYLALFGHSVNAELAVYTHHHDHTHDIHGNIKSISQVEDRG
jgi:zinc transport system ATP-binding protein